MITINGSPPIKGHEVRYVPVHAYSDLSHSSVEAGRISSWNDQFIFVAFGNANPVACYPETLIWNWQGEGDAPSK